MYYKTWNADSSYDELFDVITLLYGHNDELKAEQMSEMLDARDIPHRVRESDDSQFVGVKLILAGGFGGLSSYPPALSLCTKEDLFIYDGDQISQLLDRQIHGELIVDERPLKTPIDFALLHRLHEIIEQQGAVYAHRREIDLNDCQTLKRITDTIDILQQLYSANCDHR